jgi:predicted HicB family RNase H-like nuclease
MMEHLGYVGSVVFDDEAGIFHGQIVNTKDMITFQGQSVAELKTAFIDSIKDYLEFCAARGEPPEKPMSGKFNVRIPPKLHALASASARSKNISLNRLVQEALEQYVT